MAGCGSQAKPAAVTTTWVEPSSSVPQSRRNVLVYELESDDRSIAMADITYSTASGIEQQQGVDVPLRNKNGDAGLRLIKGRNAPTTPYFSAQMKNRRSGSLTCRITLEGKLLAEATSTGTYAIVTCKT